jgi:hypothetical protein
MRPLEMKAFEPRINGDTEVRFEPVVPWPENGLFLASCSMNLKA